MDPSPVARVLGSINDLANGSLSTTFASLAAIGAVSMTIVQIFKELTPVRTWLQRRWFKKWLHKYDALADAGSDPWSQGTSSMKWLRNYEALAGSRLGIWLQRRAVAKRALTSNAAAESQPNVFAGRGGVPTSVKLVDELADVVVGGEAKYLYELNGAELTDCILRAAPILLDEPDRYPRLLNRLVMGLAAADEAVLAVGPVNPVDPSVYFDARARALRRIERNLDGISMILTSKWRLVTQSFALVTTIAVVESALALFGQMDRESFWVAIPFGLVGGYFAPITKDILSTLQNLAVRK